MSDTLIIGGGVIGLSLAWQLALRGKKVHVVDQGMPGRATSWAGAGILPPAGFPPQPTPYDELWQLSARLHPAWARELQEETGIDTGYRECGGVYVARRHGEAAALRASLDDLQTQRIRVEEWSVNELAKAEPKLAPTSRPIVAAFHLPDESQLRNPRHVKALLAVCEAKGVKVTANCTVAGFRTQGSRIVAAETSLGPIEAEQYCLASGAWTPQIAARLGIPSLPLVPIRGQILLFKSERPLLQRIINEGPRYLVPRDDGRVLCGSTEEDAGYEITTTDAALRELRRFAMDLVPELADAEIEKSWAGLRPCSLRGIPFLGALPGWDNGFISTGHFRAGITLSPGSAVLMADLLCGEKPAIDLDYFGLARG